MLPVAGAGAAAGLAQVRVGLVVADPRGVLADFGVALPDDVEIRVRGLHRGGALPRRTDAAAGHGAWSEEQLAGLVTRDAMIGTAVL